MSGAIMIFPAIFLKKEARVLVSFPDIGGCFSEGANYEEAFINAQDALGLHIASLQERKIEVPKPSDPLDITCATNEYLAIISTDVDKYHKCKSVKKTLTIPGWLNEQAEEQRVNFSSVLQQALKEKLASAS